MAATAPIRRRSFATLPRRYRWILVAIVVADVAVLGGNLIYLTVDEPGREATHPIFSDPLWNGDVDNSWMERVGQVQLLLGVLAALVLRVRQGDAVHVVTALLLVWILADDIAILHERFGHWMTSQGVAPLGPFNAQVQGELAVWAVAGAILLTSWLFTYRRAQPAARRVTRHVMIAFGALLAFAMVLDTILAGVWDTATPLVRTLLVLTESTGELVSVGAMAAVLIVAVARTRASHDGGSMAPHAAA